MFSVVALSYIFAETMNLEGSSMNATSHLFCSFTHFQSRCHSSLDEALILCTYSSSLACPKEGSASSSSGCDIWLTGLSLCRSFEGILVSCRDPTRAPSSMSRPRPPQHGHPPVRVLGLDEQIREGPSSFHRIRCTVVFGSSM